MSRRAHSATTYAISAALSGPGYAYPASWRFS